MSASIYLRNVLTRAVAFSASAAFSVAAIRGSSRMTAYR
jgi:hypothetical protein